MAFCTKGNKYPVIDHTGEILEQSQNFNLKIVWKKYLKIFNDKVREKKIAPRYRTCDRHWKKTHYCIKLFL